nr:Gag-Pol polyprotein [Tanacetum cinerariifolium]
NDREDIGKLGAKSDISFFIGYSADSCAYRVYNQRTKKIIETMNVISDDLSAMAFVQSSSKPRLQSMTSGQISSGLDLTYASSTITIPQPTEATRKPSSTPTDTVADDFLNAMFDDNKFINPFATPSTSAAESSSSQYVDPSSMHTFYQPYPYEFQWTKDHPLEQVIREPSQPVLTRNQFRSDGDMCMKKYRLNLKNDMPPQDKALCYPKNNREDIRKLGAKGDISFFIGYSANSCAYSVYNRRTKKIIETMNVTFDKLSAMAFEQHNSKPGLQSMTFGQISSELDPNYASSTITTQQPTKHELDLLFEALYDDYIGDTAPTPTNSSSQATNFPNTSQIFNELKTQQHHVLNAMLDGNTFVNPFATPSTSAAESSSSQYVDPSNMHTFYQPYPHEYLWTKDHPLEQEAISDPAWIESMQEELLLFKRLNVWVLVPALENIKPLTLKWLFKNKHDEENTIIRNKTRLVVRGYHQKEGIDLE